MNAYSDCFAPYNGATLTCIADPIKGAEAKFQLAITKNCPTADCPECYSGGDCSAAGDGTRVFSFENQFDSFIPGVFCEQPGADAAETTCQRNTSKTLWKAWGSVFKCYDKCNKNARKNLFPNRTAGLRPRIWRHRPVSTQHFPNRSSA